MSVPSVRPASRTQRFAKPSATRWAMRQGYSVSYTPERPDFNYGHALLLDEPPVVRGVAYWLSRWHAEQHCSQCDQAFFIWEMSPARVSPTSVSSLGAPSGSALYINRCLELPEGTRVSAGPPPDGVVLRPLRGDDDWRQVVQLTALVNDDAGFFALQRAGWLYAGYRALIERGAGEWLGAFAGEQLVGALGLLRGGDEARFQDVLTLPEFRRRGICRALVRAAVDRYRAGCGDHPVFIVAQAGSDAERLYARVGFRLVSVVFELSVPRVAHGALGEAPLSPRALS